MQTVKLVAILLGLLVSWIGIGIGCASLVAYFAPRARHNTDDTILILCLIFWPLVPVALAIGFLGVAIASGATRFGHTVMRFPKYIEDKGRDRKFPQVRHWSDE